MDIYKLNEIYPKEPEFVSENNHQSDLLFRNKLEQTLTELLSNPTTFTLINLRKLLKQNNIKIFSALFDENIVRALIFLASPDIPDFTSRQNSFFVIGDIFHIFCEEEYWDTLLKLFFDHNLISLITFSLEHSDPKFVGSIYFVLNSIILNYPPLRMDFYTVMTFDLLYNTASSFTKADHCDKIVECFSTIIRLVGIKDPDEAIKLLTFFHRIIIKKLEPKLNQFDQFSITYCLDALISFLKSDSLPSDTKKLLIENSFIPCALQMFFLHNDFSNDVIKATIIISQFYAMDIKNIPYVLKKIIDLFQYQFHDLNYNIIASCVNDIIRFSSDEVFGHLIGDLHIIDIILDILQKSSIKMKKEIYECLHSIIQRLPQVDMAIVAECIQLLFSLIQAVDDKWLRELVFDIYDFFITAETNGNLGNLLELLNDIDAKTQIEEILDKDTLGQELLLKLLYIYEKMQQPNDE